MDTLRDENLENVHVLHQSVIFLLFKGAVAWLIGLVLLLVLESSWRALLNFFSGSESQPMTFTEIPIITTTYPWLTGLYILLFVFYGWVVLLIVLHWIYNYYIIEPKNIISRNGIIFSKEARFNMELLQSVAVRQGFFGKIFNYGTIELFNPELEKKVFLRNIPDPYKESKFIEKLCPNTGASHILIKH